MAIKVVRLPVSYGTDKSLVHHKSDSLFRETFLREVACRDIMLKIRLEQITLQKEDVVVQSRPLLGDVEKYQPWRRLRDADNPPQYSVTDAQIRQRYVSRALGTSKASLADVPTRLLLSKLFAAYCGFLRDKEWIYDSGLGVAGKATLSDKEYNAVDLYLDKGIYTLSPFMLPGRPQLNCQEAALGLVYAMIQVGISPRSISLVKISARAEREGVVFVGWDRAMGIVHRTRYFHLMNVGLEVSANGAGVDSIPLTQDSIDSPFDHHYFVKCEGMYWDPTYGIAFSTIDWVFTTCQEWLMLDPPGSASKGTKDLLYLCPALHTWIAVINTVARSNRTKSVLANSAAGRFVAAKQDAVTRRVGVERGTVEVPAVLWRLLADGIPALRDCLSRAVDRYEADSAFWRQPSDQSKQALWAIRKYLGRQDLAGLSVTKRKEYYPATITQDATVWSDEQAADFTQRVLSGTRKVGDRLKAAIKTACQDNAAIRSLFA